ncbi:ATP-dependent RNA helicase MRH4 [Cereibacter sphaeroides KD131]|nr:ATP-dependent RNA helicase MRH4 [Cereibacter sphaeroides KD131]
MPCDLRISAAPCGGSRANVNARLGGGSPAALPPDGGPHRPGGAQRASRAGRAAVGDSLRKRL